MPRKAQSGSDHRQEPGPGQSTAEQAFSDVRKEIARRNERAQEDARKLRAAREQERLKWRHDRDS